ncbi:MAG: LysR family transcriptional regulator [bacterium]|nr:LysR family transcriptional regulator [bacterium]
MELILLRTLVAVAEAGSFTAAAERLCVTQSAVSRRIRQLEEHYGVSLLERGSDSVSATPAGRLLVDKAREILEIERQLEHKVAEHKHRDRIAFCCTPCFGAGRLPDIFERYVGGSGLNFDLNVVFEMPEDVLEGLSSGRYDLAVVEHCDELYLADCQRWELPPDEMVFVSAPSLDITAQAVSIDDLASRRLFLKTFNGCAYRFLRRRLRELGRGIDDFTNLTYYDDLAGVVRQVVAGHGLGFVSRELAARELDNGLLREHRVAGFGHQRPRTMLVSPRLRRTELTLRFVATFFEVMGAEPPAELVSGLQPFDTSAVGAGRSVPALADTAARPARAQRAG